MQQNGPFVQYRRNHLSNNCARLRHNLLLAKEPIGRAIRSLAKKEG